jgi:iron complex outermembrane receptor protein
VPNFTTIGILNAVNGNYVGGGVAVNGGDLNFTALMLNAGLRYTKIQFFKPFVSFSQSFSVADLGLVLRAARKIQSWTSIKAVKANNYEFGFSVIMGDSPMKGNVPGTLRHWVSYVFILKSADCAFSENLRF